MANHSTEKEEHAYKRIDREIKSNIVKNLLFLYGRENFLIHWAVDTLVQKWIFHVLTVRRSHWNR